jgi:hypothetical protein
VGNRNHRIDGSRRSHLVSRTCSPPWNRQRIIDALRELHRRGMPLWSRSIRRSHLPLYAAARHWFGSYSLAIQSAGLEYNQIRRMTMGRWNRKTVVRELRKLHREKVPLHHAAIERHRRDLVLAAYRYFGSYRSAVEAAGLPYDRIRVRTMPSWDRQRIIRRLHRFKQEGHGLWQRAVRKEEPYLVRAAKRCFGSYESAAKAAGIELSLLVRPNYRIWSPQVIVQKLRGLYARSPSRLKPARLQLDHPQLYRASGRRFSTYRKALEAAGIAYAGVARVTSPCLPAPQVIEQLQDLFEKGKDMRYSRMAIEHPRLLNASRRRFGSYVAAMKSAKLDYPPAAPMRHWTAAIVINTLRELNCGQVDLRLRMMKRTRLPLYEAARHYFGNYPCALRAAGIDCDVVERQCLRREIDATDIGPQLESQARHVPCRVRSRRGKPHQAEHERSSR